MKAADQVASISQRCPPCPDHGLKRGSQRWIGDRGIAIGIDRYGASAPAKTIFKELGFTTERVVDAVKSLVAK